MDVLGATEGSEGFTASHIGFLVKDYAALKAKLAAANISTVFEMEKNKQIMVTFPTRCGWSSTKMLPSARP